MTKRQYRKFKPEQKFKNVKEALTTDTKIRELREKYEVKSSHFRNWQEQIYRVAREAFDRGKDVRVTSSSESAVFFNHSRTRALEPVGQDGQRTGTQGVSP